MKAIQTKYLPFTNTRPSRIVAKAEGVKAHYVTCNALDEWRIANKLEHITNHQAAARLLAEKYKWDTALCSGGLPDGTWCHCFIPESVVLAIKFTDEHFYAKGNGSYGFPHETVKEARASLNI